MTDSGARVVSEKVSPAPEELAALLSRVPDGPVVLINLLKFKPGGRDVYRRYLHAAYKAFDPLAGPQPEALYTGVAGPDLAGGAEWDFVIVAQWSSAKHFVHQQLTDEYRNRAVPLRTEALERATLMMTFPSDPRAIWS